MTVPFDLNTFLPYRLNRAAEAVSLDFATVYRGRFGMTRPEWRVLAHLGPSATITARDICDRSGLHKTKVSRAVYALERRGWLRRRTDERDRRIEHLSLTTRGHAAYSELEALATAHDTALRNRLTKAELETLNRALDKLAGKPPAVER